MRAHRRVALRLEQRGYPSRLAQRVALTPPLRVEQPSDDPFARPGRELREYVDLHFGQVVSMVAAAITPARRLP